jgi:hypothetical protein
MSKTIYSFGIMNHRRPGSQFLGREEEKIKTFCEGVINLKITNFKKPRLKTAGNKEYTILQYINSKYA